MTILITYSTDTDNNTDSDNDTINDDDTVFQGLVLPGV